MRHIFDAIDEGDINKLKSLVNPADINLDYEEGTALFYAVSTNKSIEIVKVLTSFEYIDLNKANIEFGSTPLSEAVRLKRADIIKLLCKDNRVEITHKDWATREKQEEMFELEVFYPLLVRLSVTGGQKFDINRCNKSGDSLLHMAVLTGNCDEIKFLCDKRNFDFLKTFQILKNIIRKNSSVNNELDFILQHYLTESAVPKSTSDNVPNILENIFKTADSRTSILSEIARVKNATSAKVVKSICTALHNVIINRLKLYANHKRLRYLFYKGSVFKTFVQIFVDLEDEKSDDGSEYLAQLLRVLYISTQANIKCDCVNGKNNRSNEKSEENDVPASHSDTLPLSPDTPENTGLPDEETDVYARSLRSVLGNELYANFKERIIDISGARAKQEINRKTSDQQLIAKGIYDAYFKAKDRYGCCDAIQKNVIQANDWLSSKFRLNEIFHKCICRGNFAFILIFMTIFVHASDIYSDARFGFKTLASFSKRLGLTMIVLVFLTLIHENIRSVISTYDTDKELLRISLGQIDLSDEDLAKNSELNYYNDSKWWLKWVGRFFWTFKVYRTSKKITLESLKPLLFNVLSLLMLRPVVDRLIVLTHSPSHLRAIYRQQSKQKSLNQYYMILEQMPELLIQFYVFQIYFNNLRTPDDYTKYGCTELHSFTYRTEYFECVENLWRLQICAPWWEIYSMLVPFVKIPNSMVSLEEMFRKLSPETPKMSTAASACLYIAYILMIPSRLFLFAAVMHSATDHLYVMAYLGLVTFAWLTINVYTVTRRNKNIAKNYEDAENEKEKGWRVGHYIKIIWSLLLFTIRDVIVISLRRPDAYLLPPSEVHYKTLRTWRRMLAISSYYFIEGVVGAVFVEHYYPCGRNTEIIKYQGWFYLITLIISVTMISLLSYALQPAKINIIPQLFRNRAATICLSGLLMWAVGVIAFTFTTTNSRADIVTSLIILTAIILPIFLVIVVLLKFFSEAKHPKERKNKHFSKDESCCSLFKINCISCTSQTHDWTVDEKNCSATQHQASKRRSALKDSVEPTTAQKLRLPAFLKQMNTYKEVSSVEDIKMASAGNISEAV